MMTLTLYSLSANGKPVCVVQIEHPAWLPIKPKPPMSWLRGVVTSALRAYLSRAVVRA